MQDDDLADQTAPEALMMASTWMVTLFTGVVTLILGIIVAFKPGGTLNVVAVLLGVLALISGIFQLVRVFDRAESHRVWLGISSFVFVVVGVVLIRHLHLTVALIGLLVGITWIVQGVAALIAAFSGAREGAAVGAGPGVALVLGDLRESAGQLDHLVPTRRGVARAGLVRQGRLAAAAMARDEADDAGDPLGGQALAQVGLVAGLGTGLSAGGLLGDGLGGGGRIGRGG